MRDTSIGEITSLRMGAVCWLAGEGLQSTRNKGAPLPYNCGLELSIDQPGFPDLRDFRFRL